MIWTKDKIIEALPNAKLFGFEDRDISACGIFVTSTNAGENMICAIRKEDETAGIALVAFNQFRQKFDIPAIMCTDYECFKDIGLPVIEVEDISKALYAMAYYVRGLYQGKVVAITGSAGKSTTTGICYNALTAYGADGNINKANTVYGISWNMAGYDLDVPFWVNEVSLNKGMYPSAKLVSPDVAVITNIAPVHLKVNETIETVAELKSRIFYNMKEGSFAVLYNGMAQYEKVLSFALAKKLKVITFGQDDSANIQIYVNENGCGLKIFGHVCKISKYPLPIHILLDMAAVAGVFIVLGLTLDDKLFNVFRNFRPLQGRSAIVRGKLADNSSVLIMDESYNANPLSMKMTIQSFDSLYKDKENKILILGDMSEGGLETIKQHKDLADIVLGVNPAHVILVGQYMSFLYYELKDKLKATYYSGVEALLEDILTYVSDNAYVFIKGSHSVGLGKLVDFFIDEFKKDNIQN